MFLLNEFPRFPAADIRRIFVSHSHHLAPTHRALCNLQKDQSNWGALGIHPLSAVRKIVDLPDCPDSMFDEEVAFIRKRVLAEQCEGDDEVARRLNETFYRACGQCIECSVCFVARPFEELVQCAEGHLLCHQCVRQYVSNCLSTCFVPPSRLL